MGAAWPIFSFRYSRQDKALVAPLVAALEAEGWSVWWDPEITPGEEFDALISRELESARSLVVVWTPNSVDSRWVRGEARDAADRGVLVPVRFAERQAADRLSRGAHDRPRRLGRGLPGAPRSAALCKALEAKLGAPKRPVAATDAAKEKRAQVSICVLPFANMSGDPEQEYFSDGITEDVITDLGKVSALSIVSRNMAFSFKGAKGGVGEIGRQTKAAYVLVGSVRKAGERVRITAQLVNAANEAQVWGERYDRDLNDIFALQDEISKAIVAALKLTLLPEEKRALEQRATTNVQAYKFYLMARQFSVMGNERHQEIIMRLCKRAVELDPSYAAPWATMAIAQWDMHRRSAGAEDGQRGRQRRDPAGPETRRMRTPRSVRCYQGAGPLRGRLDGVRGGSAARSRIVRGQPDRRHVQHGAAPLRRLRSATSRPRPQSIEAEFMAASFAMQMYAAKGDLAGARAAAKQGARAHREGDRGRTGSRARAWIWRRRARDPRRSRSHEGVDRARCAARSEQHDPALQLHLRARASG